VTANAGKLNTAWLAGDFRGPTTRSWETAKTKTRSKKSSSGETASSSVD